MNAVIEVRKHSRLNFGRLPALAKREIDSATLPSLYIEAKKSLAQLVKVDEVKEIADKHSAIAHYAKQIKDNSLLHYAERVYARALARIGELLAELPKAERAAAAKANGISPTDAGHAVNAAAVPKRAFESMVERTPPASKQEISTAGFRARNPVTRERARRNFSAYTEQEPFPKIRTTILALSEHFMESGSAETGDWWKVPADLADWCTPEEARHLRERLAPLIDYLDALDQRLAHRATAK